MSYQQTLRPGAIVRCRNAQIISIANCQNLQFGRLYVVVSADAPHKPTSQTLSGICTVVPLVGRPQEYKLTDRDWWAVQRFDIVANP